MAKTNEGLVEFAKRALADGWRYWYGTTGVRCTPQLLQRKTAQYPAHYKSNRMTRYNRDIAEGRYCADCIGLAKGYMWLDEKTGAQRYKSNDCPDASANGMYNRATEKGGIASMPEIPGLMLHMDGHAGIYIGGGQVVEARGFNYGVVRTELKKRPWKHWYKLPGCAYAEKDPGAGEEKEINPYPEPVKNLRRGAVGDGVKWVQWELLRRGYDLGSDGIDGEFGRMTDAAVRGFQRENGLVVDGIVGTRTRGAMKGK